MTQSICFFRLLIDLKGKILKHCSSGFHLIYECNNQKKNAYLKVAADNEGNYIYTYSTCIIRLVKINYKTHEFPICKNVIDFWQENINFCSSIFQNH